MSDKYRNFRFIFYPDVDNLEDLIDWIVEFWRVETYISPLHTDGSKPHYHVVMCFDSPRSLNAISDRLRGKFGGITEVMSCKSKVGDLKYLCHLGNPNKLQYSPADVTCLNGADYSPYSSSGSVSLYDLLQIIDSSGFINYSSFLLSLHGSPDLFSIATAPKYSALIRSVISSHNLLIDDSSNPF